jgi:protein involved in polysaccharide export with SLBB domain
MISSKNKLQSRIPARLCLIIAFGIVALGKAQAQAPDSTGGRQKVADATRQHLDSLAAELDLEVSQAPDPQFRLQKQAEVNAVRERLVNGDFQAGDRIVLLVQGDSTLSDTFAVRAGQLMDLPNIGEIPLHGILRSELQPYLTDRIGKFVKSPVVQTSSLMRIAVMGQVGKPGFYATSPDILLSDAVMLAGGPIQSADLGRTEIKRGTETLWKSKDVQTAFTAGMTLEQMNMRAGDEIIVGQKTPKNYVQYIQAGAVLLGIALSVYGTTKLGKKR